MVRGQAGDSPGLAFPPRVSSKPCPSRGARLFGCGRGLGTWSPLLVSFLTRRAANPPHAAGARICSCLLRVIVLNVTVHNIRFHVTFKCFM